MDFLNLDEVVPSDRHFRMGGVEYTIPGEIPLRSMLEFSRYGQMLQQKPDDMEALSGSLKSLFELVKQKTENADFDKFCADMTIERFMAVSQFVFNKEVQAVNVDAKKKSISG